MDENVFNVFKAFCDSFHESVASMTGLPIKRLKLGTTLPVEAPFFTIITGFKGPKSGSVLLKCSAAAILRLYAKYLGEDSNKIDADVIDGVRELASIVNGAASAKEQQLKLNFTPSMTIYSEVVENHVSKKAIGAATSFFVEDCGVFTVEIHQ